MPDVKDKKVDEAIEKIDKDVKQMQERTMEVVIENDEDKQDVAELLVNLKRRHNRVEGLRKEFTKPLLDHKRAIDKRFKDELKPLEKMIDKVKGVIGSYQRKKEEEARKEEERLRKQKEKKNEKREEKGQELDLTTAPEVAKPDNQTETEDGGKTVVNKRWTYDIEDESEIPREYLKVDKGSIRKAVREGKREIAGVKIYQEESVSVYT